MRKIYYLVLTLMAISSSFVSSSMAMEDVQEDESALQPPPKKRAHYWHSQIDDNEAIGDEDDIDESSLFTDEEEDKDISNLCMSISDGEGEEDHYSSYEVKKRIDSSSEEQPVTYSFVPTDDLTPEETNFFQGKIRFLTRKNRILYMSIIHHAFKFLPKDYMHSKEKAPVLTNLCAILGGYEYFSSTSQDTATYRNYNAKQEKQFLKRIASIVLESNSEVDFLSRISFVHNHFNRLSHQGPVNRSKVEYYTFTSEKAKRFNYKINQDLIRKTLKYGIYPTNWNVLVEKHLQIMFS
ncbi:MAG: hypothetical protein K2Y18_01240 [Alphaproteobacteria bacterium]|jgi:hypothetical protein|nr:hypothetical protein [Alphaproteobacteria bacterium]